MSISSKPLGPGADDEDMEDNEDEGGAATVSIDIVFNLDEMAKDTNLGVVIDQIEHMEGIMKVIFLYSPFGRHSTLDVTAMHFFEPSFTDRDVFVSLNEDNKLLSVEEEVTSINLNTIHVRGPSPNPSPSPNPNPNPNPNHPNPNPNPNPNPTSTHGAALAGRPTQGHQI